MSYGNIMAVEVNPSGVSRSHAMARDDADRMEKYRSKINSVAHAHGLDPALIAGIISRESSAGAGLRNGWGDHGNAWGLMQVDKRWHTPNGAWDSEEHLSQATGILVYFIGRMQGKFSGLSREKQLKGGIAAYNTGDGKVHSYERVDEETHHGNYSNDVVARAQWYKRNKNY